MQKNIVIIIAAFWYSVKYILKAYATAKKLHPSLDHRAYNETIDVQINLMKKGVPALVKIFSLFSSSARWQLF